jgi:hypothetical protein
VPRIGLSVCKSETNFLTGRVGFAERCFDQRSSIVVVIARVPVSEARTANGPGFPRACNADGFCSLLDGLYRTFTSTRYDTSSKLSSRWYSSSFGSARATISIAPTATALSSIAATHNSRRPRPDHPMRVYHIPSERRPRDPAEERKTLCRSKPQPLRL